MNLEAVPFDERFRDASWEWFQDEKLRYLTGAPNFSRKDQLIWFDSLTYRDDYDIVGILADGVPVGACGISHITDSSAKYFSYVAPSEYRGKGIGRFMHDIGVAMARERGVKKLWGIVVKDNEWSLAAHLKYGWRVVGTTERTADSGIPIEYVV